MDWRNILSLVGDFIVAHKSEILLVLAGIATFTWEWLKAACIALMLQMEKLAREELELGGSEKLALVIQLFNEKYFGGRLPETVIHTIAQRWYDESIRE